MESEGGPLPEDVLYRIVRGDNKGRAFGTPRNPRPPTTQEFNRRIVELKAGELAGMIIARRHGILPEQAERIAQMTDEELTAFRVEDPISATQRGHGLSLTGGHHRTNEIIQRVQGGRLPPDRILRILLHD